jgi:hypothetical protein
VTNQKKNIKMTNLNSIWLGLKKGYQIETLPNNVRTLLELPLVRIFRVIGGCFAGVLFYLLDKNGTITINLSYNLNMIIYIIALIQFIQIFIVSVWRIVYGINKLLYHKEEFEIRNSPLNRLASMTGHLLYCWKVGIQAASVGLSIFFVYLVIDVLRENVVNIAVSPLDNINVIVNMNFIMLFSNIRLNFNSFKDKFSGSCQQVWLNFKSKILNIFSLAFILFLIYKLIIGLTITPTFGSYVFIISLICSFIISHYISKKFSSNLIIRLLQKYVLLNIVVFVFSIIYGCFILPEIYCADEDLETKDKRLNSNEEAVNSNSKNTNTKVHLNIESVNKGGKEMYDVKFQMDKETADNLVRRGGKVVREGVETAVPYIGVGAAAGKVGSTAFTALKHLPPAQRVASTGAVVVVTAGATYVGIEGGKAIVKNKTVEESIKNAIKDSKHADISKDRVPSPDNDFVNSPFEENIPLVTLLNAIWTFNILELILMVILVWLLFNKYLKNYSFNISSKIVHKYMGDKFIEKFEKYQKIFENLNNKFSVVMYMWVGLLLIIIKLVNIYFSGVLYYDIDNYVLVYNHYKNIESEYILPIIGNFMFSGNIKKVFNKDLAGEAWPEVIKVSSSYSLPSQFNKPIESNKKLKDLGVRCKARSSPSPA